MRVNSRVRWKPVRLIIDRLKGLLYGWDCRTRRLSGIPEDWFPISCFSMPIRMRPELRSVNRHRIENMKLACSFISGTVLEPGHVFSMFRIVGNPSERRGFKPGPTIVQGKLMTTSGGSLCQISTAVFNAALLTNLEIIEKHNHTTDIWGEQRMIDLGRDAAYVFALSDLKVRGNSGTAIAFFMEVDEVALQLHCRIVSREPLHPRVRIVSKPVSDPSTPNRTSVQTTRFARDEHDREIVTYRKTESYRIPESRP